MQKSIFNVFTTRDICYIQICSEERKIFIDLYEFFKSSSIILWAFKFIQKNSSSFKPNDTVFSSKNKFFQISIQKGLNEQSEMKIVLKNETEIIFDFSYEELTTCSKALKQFYITFITSHEPWIYVKERRLGEYY